jgi:hypothetical protein
MRPIVKLTLLLSCICPLMGACATSSAAFGPSGYEQTAFHYQIRYADSKAQRLLGGKDWRLDNLIWDDTIQGWSHKKGSTYTWTRAQDTDQDGTISAQEQHEEGVFDLRFVHTRDQSVIWTKAHPLLLNDAGQDLDVILENYAEQLSGEGLYTAGTIFSAATLKTRKFVSFIVDRAPLQIGPNLAVVATIELAETERLRMEPAHRSSMVRIVFTKLAYQNRMDDRSVPGAQEETVRCGSSTCNRGIVLLVAGYYNDAAHFPDHLGEFEDLVKRISVPPEGLLPSHRRSRPVKTSPPPPPATPPPEEAPTPPPPPTASP